jgi:hypothetical protein
MAEVLPPGEKYAYAGVDARAKIEGNIIAAVRKDIINCVTDVEKRQ